MTIGAGLIAARALLESEGDLRPALDLLFRAVARAATEQPQRASHRADHSPCSRRARSLRPRRLANTSATSSACSRSSPLAIRSRRSGRLAHGWAIFSAKSISKGLSRLASTTVPSRGQLRSLLAQALSTAGSALQIPIPDKPRQRLAAQVKAASLQLDAVGGRVGERSRARSRGRCRVPAPDDSQAWRARSPARPSRQPTSSTGSRASSATASSSNNSRHMRVVACAPVPKACAGSITISSASGRCSAPPTADARAATGRPSHERHRAAARSAPADETASSAQTNRRRPRWSRSRPAHPPRQPARPATPAARPERRRRRIRRSLSAIAARQLDLLDAAGRKLEQIGEHELGVARRR